MGLLIVFPFFSILSRRLFVLEVRGGDTPINPFIAPEPLPILNPSNFVPKNGFSVVKGSSVTSTSIIDKTSQHTELFVILIGRRT